MIADVGHPIVAALYDRMLARAESAGLSDRRADLLADLRGDVLEIGAGTGLNLARYPSSPDRLVLVEPDPHMAKRLRDRVASEARDFPVEVIAGSAEALPFDDASFDTVVSTLVLCTVDSPERAVAEIARVLRPGGELRLIEHVRDPHSGAEPGSRISSSGRGVGSPARCHPNRDTAATLAAAGFDTSGLEPGEFKASGPW